MASKWIIEADYLGEAIKQTIDFIARFTVKTQADSHRSPLHISVNKDL